ncbi:MAG: hypothetical protein CME69_09415 [Halobacteriovorax sp.]|nr:hypothetical protein [Halobacteriovorax sp.]|tara:strand:+ start:1832 stop:2497 length:666 start_codon:yes stop_codon:yes gene_type:complete
MTKFQIIIYLIVVQFSANALSFGECVADPSSKRYMNDVFYDKYPKTFIFKCSYDCLSSDGIVKITAISSAISYNLRDDARKVVCEGVKVKEIPYGFEFDKVIPFFSHQTRTKEIKEWALKNIPVFTDSSRKLLNHFYRQIDEVAKSYLVAGRTSLFFKEAGEALSLIVNEKDEKVLLRQYLVLLNKKLKMGPLGHELTSENLILKSIYAHGRWMLPNYVEK